jgi:zinc transporter
VTIDEPTEDTGYLRFAMTERLLVSGRHQPLCAVDATRRALESGHRIESVAGLIETIVENIADVMERIADRIAQSLDKIEEKVLPDDTDDLRQLLDHQAGLAAASRQAGAAARRADHSVVELRDRSRLLQEELHLKIEEQGNNSLRVLSVLTALLMPPTLVTGIFGMNTKGLPFTDLDSAFLWASLLMVLSSLAAYLLMKRIGLIR